ncbi:MAG: CCA tRNA nucleotidyltransferase [Clostridia bacterium]|nr:CCA tRNA nucleotidyltransferase [Clostridia bacterium]
MVIKIPPQVNRAIEILEENGHSAYVVGGAVRDAIMGKTADDWDITTSALPEETVRAFNGFRVIETGIKHGTVTVIVDGTPLEITTYRIETGYSDNRHPDRVDFTDRIEVDLSRRDFTVNSIAYSPKRGFADPFGGKKDIDNKLIRSVGEADRRFGEDALRILRALRFSSVLGFEIEPGTAESIHRNCNSLKNISVERIFVELSKLLCGKDAGRILREYEDIFFFILPELKPMKNCLQNHERHIFDVWGHTVKAVESVEPVPEMRFAMLLHDSGKPHCKITDENGTDHFYGHSKVSRKIAEDVLLKLKTSTAFRNRICDLVEYHDFLPDKISKKTYKKYIAKLGYDTVKDLFEIRKSDISAQNPKFLAEELVRNESGLKILEEISSEEKCFKITDLAIGGRELVLLGLKPSPKTGKILEILLDEVMDEKIENTHEALNERALQLIKQQERRDNGNCKN